MAIRTWILVLVGLLSACAAQPAAPKKVASPRGLVLGYSATWFDPTYPPSAYDYGSLTHIARSFLVPRADGSISVPGEFFREDLERLAHAKGVKLLASIGGASDKADHWLTMARTPAARDRFFAELSPLIEKNHYDGIDIDWEPSAQTDPDQQTFTEFMHALRARFPKWTIATALSAHPWSAKHISWEQIAADVDYINIMAYDYAGAWTGFSAHPANLHKSSVYTDKDGRDVAADLEALITERKVPAKKVLFGLPFYGVQFSTNKLGDKFRPDEEIRGSQMNYGDVEPLVASKRYKKLWDDGAHAAYLERVSGNRTITYDDPRVIADKCAFAQEHKLAGVMIWHLGADLVHGVPALQAVIADKYGLVPQEPNAAFLSQYLATRKKVAGELRDQLIKERDFIQKVDPDTKLAPLPKEPSRREDKPLDAMDRWIADLRFAVDETAKAKNDIPIDKRRGRKVEPKGGALVFSDFEGGTLGHALDGAWVADFDGNGLGTKMKVEAGPSGRSGSTKAMHVSGHLGKSQAPWPYAVALASFSPSDLSPFTMLRLWVKGDGKSYMVTIGRQAVTDYGTFRVTFTAPKEWTKLELPLADFKQPDWARAVARGLFDVTALGVSCSASMSDEDFDLWVDDVELVAK
jgi:chitinase